MEHCCISKVKLCNFLFFFQKKRKLLIKKKIKKGIDKFENSVIDKMPSWFLRGLTSVFKHFLKPMIATFDHQEISCFFWRAGEAFLKLSIGLLIRFCLGNPKIPVWITNFPTKLDKFLPKKALIFPVGRNVVGFRFGLNNPKTESLCFGFVRCNNTRKPVVYRQH